jgi:hypothetical protein
VLVTGSSIGSGGNFDYATIKYSSAGVPLWTNRYSGPANSDDQAQAVAVDASGNAFVTGYSGVSASFPNSYDYVTIKYSSAGVALWINRYNGVENGGDQAQALAIDSNGNLLVTGASYLTSGSGSHHDFATVKYSNDGAALWTNRYHGPANSGDYAQAVAVNQKGDVFVTGYSSSTNDEHSFFYNNFDYVTIKYSGGGAPLWTNRYVGPGNGDDIAHAIAVDSNGDVFVTGYSASSNAPPVNYDYLTIKYSNAGVPLWTNRYNGMANGDDRPESRSCLAIGLGGAAYVTGASDGDYTSNMRSDFATVKYISVPELSIGRTPDGSGGYFIRCAGHAGYTYQLQRTPNVTGPWSAIATNSAPPSGLVEFHDLFPLTGQGFYRVLAP